MNNTTPEVPMSDIYGPFIPGAPGNAPMSRNEDAGQPDSGQVGFRRCADVGQPDNSPDSTAPFVPEIATDSLATNRRVFYALDAQARALSGLATVALDKGDHETAATYTADAAALIGLMTVLNAEFGLLCETASDEEIIRFM